MRSGLEHLKANQIIGKSNSYCKPPVLCDYIVCLLYCVFVILCGCYIVCLLYSSASLLYKGYLDDSRNTDNAWVEAEVWNFHFDMGDNFDLRQDVSEE